MKLLSIFRKKPNSFNRDGLIVKSAFKCGGIEYMEVDNIYALPYQRGMQAVRIYEEVKMKCDYDFLKAHCTAVNNVFGNKSIGFSELQNIKKLNDQLLERLNHIVDTDLLYKLASVVFFDSNESPFEYDWNYAQKKIEHWKKNADAHAFFLQEPLQRLIPFLKQPDLNFQDYSNAVRKINEIHWDTVYSLLSESQKKSFSGSKSFYVKEILPNSKASSD